jgi:hypothetical protein
MTIASYFNLALLHGALRPNCSARFRCIQGGTYFMRAVLYFANAEDKSSLHFVNVPCLIYSRNNLILFAAHIKSFQGPNCVQRSPHSPAGNAYDSILP